MQKIRCPRCGVVNLEKFLTYPRCAGCGSTLPAPATAPAPFWKRSFGAQLWIPFLGVALVALVAMASLLTPPEEDKAQLLIYGNAARRVAVEQTVILTMTLDAVAQTRLQHRSDLQNVKLRLPQALFKDFAFVALEPAPDETLKTNGGRYFQYASLPRESTLRLRLYARRAGRYRVRADFYADDYAPGFFSITVLVVPPTNLPQKP
jgi:hypothetical protein